MRTVAPEIFSDEFFGNLSPVERLLWLGLLLVCADDQGRMIDNSAMIRNLIFPYDDNTDVSREMVDSGLEKFEHLGKVLRYTAGMNGTGKKLIQVTNWWRYQKSASWMAASKFPSPDGWTDRCKYHSCGNQIIMTNWTHPGGFLSSTLPSALPTPLPIPLLRREDEDEVNTNKEKETLNIKESSSSRNSEEKLPAVAAADLVVLEKIFIAAGAKVKQRQYLKTTDGITPEDCWAMLAWTYAQNKFRKPGVIMAENILSGEKASADWYTESCWEIIPAEVRRSGGLACQGDENSEETSLGVATRISSSPEESNWQAAVDQLEQQMPRGVFDHWVRDSRFVSYDDGLFTVGVCNITAQEWLESNLLSTAVKLLMGIMDRTVDINFVVLEEVPA